jgi:predicted DNA binding CopG/RHH family protein
VTSKTTNYALDDATTDKWESGELGRSLEHAEVADVAASDSLDESLGLQLVSIRLQRSLIQNLKIIAKYRGVAYQPLVRDLLNRFAVSELKLIFGELEAAQRRAAEEEDSIVADFIAREQERKRA